MVSPEAGRPLRRDAQRNRQRVIEAAREVFATRGLHATLDDVAHHAGVGVGTVYRRFPTKEALVAVILEDRLEEMVALAESALAAPTGWDGLTMFLGRATELHASDRGLRDVALSAGFGTEHHARKGERMAPLVRRLIERAQAEGSLRADVNAEDVPLMLLMISEVAQHCRDVRPDIFARYRRLMIDGLRARPVAGDLGRPLTPGDVTALSRDWLPRSLTNLD
ncbi:TetR/AcrR family transcriptional regulator [Actinoplanes sp. NPDC051494]|uniref:TetR/AcrR family transcriptional regulator n=1 Tax=Actinoplanes sp. NPDC051494 TaxID=3363907 RepID=UPI0037B673B7